MAVADPVLTELILEEKRLKGQIAVLDHKLEEPLAKLAKARDLLLKVKAAYEAALAPVRALKSDKILLEGELELIMDKKREARMRARLAEAGGIRPGTHELVEQMNEMAGDRETFEVSQATKRLDVEADLAELRESMGDTAGDGS